MRTARREAVAQGQTHYFTGIACRKGHVAPRYTKTATCVDCSREGVATWAAGNPAARAQKRKAGKASKLQRTPSWSNPEECARVYAEAAALTATTGIEHHVDHEIPLRGKLVSGLHVHQNLRVMVGAENLLKSNHYVPQ